MAKRNINKCKVAPDSMFYTIANIYSGDWVVNPFKSRACRVFTKQHWSCSEGSWGPNNVHIFFTIHHICVDALLSDSGAALGSLLSLDLLQKASTETAQRRYAITLGEKNHVTEGCANMRTFWQWTTSHWGMVCIHLHHHETLYRRCVCLQRKLQGLLSMWVT